MQHILARAFAFSMREEGGDQYTNDPRDPGGPLSAPTRGISRATLPAKPEAFFS